MSSTTSKPGPRRSKHFNIRVVDLPSVKQIKVTYHYPSWTGLKDASEDSGGDLRALEGTRADLEVVTDRPLTDGLLVLDGGTAGTSLGWRRQSLSERGPDRAGRRVPRGRTRSRSGRSSLRGLLHRSAQGQPARDQHREAGRRLPRERDRRGDGRRQGAGRIRPQGSRSSLLRQRWSREDRSPAQAARRQAGVGFHACSRWRISSWCPAIW